MQMRELKAHEMLRQVLVCPYEHDQLDGDFHIGLACRSCKREYPVKEGVVNFLAHEAAFQNLTYHLPHHPVPQINRMNRFVSRLRSLPIYHRLFLTSDQFSLTLERLIYQAVKSHKMVLDIGCREGINLLYSNGADLAVGVDIDFNSVYYTNEMSNRHGYGILASGTRLPFASGSFDLILCCDVIEHVKEYTNLIAEIGRVARPSSTLILSTPDGDVVPKPYPFHVKHFSEGDLFTLLAPNFPHLAIRSIVRNCDVRKDYWSFRDKHPNAYLKALALNLMSNIQFYLYGYHKNGSSRRADVSDATFIVHARKELSCSP